MAELANARFSLSLLFFRGVISAVFLEVAFAAREFDALDDFGAVDIEGDGEYGIKSARFVGELRGGLRQILDKYGISEYELNEIYDRLTDGLTWGQE